MKRFIEGGSKMNLFRSGGKSISEVYGLYADMLYRLALSNLGNREDAEDAVHDVFEKYISRPFLFTDGEHEKSWFIRATLNRCRDIYRKKKIRNHASIDEVAHLHTEESEDYSALTAALSAVDEKYREVIILHYFEGYSVEETAEMLSISISAAKMRLARGREKLKFLLERED